MSDMPLGERLKKARAHAHLTQAQLEARSGVSQKTISKIERGDQEGSTQVAQLAKACGVSIDWLATEAGAMLEAPGVREPPAKIYQALSEDAIAVAREWSALTPERQSLFRELLTTVQAAARSDKPLSRREPRLRVRQGKPYVERNSTPGQTKKRRRVT